MKKITLFFVLVISTLMLFSCSSDDDIADSSSPSISIDQKLIGKWYTNEYNSKEREPNSYTFKNDKTVSYKYYVPSEGWNEENGTWSLEGNKLTMKFIKDVVESIMNYSIEINDSGIMKMTSLNGNGANQNFYKADNVKLLPTLFRKFHYEYDENNRIKTITISNQYRATIKYSGDLITEVSWGWLGNINTRRVIYKDKGEILLYSDDYEENKLQGILTVKNNLLISEKFSLNSVHEGTHIYEYDDNGNLTTEYEKIGDNMFINSSYTYDLTQGGVFRNTATPRWILTYLTEEDPSFFSPNLVKTETDYDGKVYDIICEDYQYGYPKKITEKGNNESNTFDIVYTNYTK